MISTNIDYVDTYFKYPILTKIHGKPYFETLKVIKDQLLYEPMQQVLPRTSEEVDMAILAMSRLYPNTPPSLQILTTILSVQVH